MDKSKVALIPFALSTLLLAVPAHAYVGPGAGLSLLGALWALLAAIAAAVIFVIAWPIRRMRRRKREAQAQQVRKETIEHSDGRRGQPEARHRGPADSDDDRDRLQAQ